MIIKDEGERYINTLFSKFKKNYTNYKELDLKGKLLLQINISLYTESFIQLYYDEYRSVKIEIPNNTKLEHTYGYYESYLQSEIKGIYMNRNYDGTAYQIVKCYKEYYKTSLKTLKVGDIVYVDSEVEQVREVKEVFSMLKPSVESLKALSKAEAWVICKINTTDHDKKKEQTEVNRALRMQLDEKIKTNQNLQAYAMLAESDPQAKAMLEQLQGIDTSKLLTK